MALNIDTNEIRNAALAIRAQNDELQAALLRSKSAADGLSAAWSGSAAETAIGVYGRFAEKSIHEYHSMLKNYADFLSDQAGEGYEHAESSVIQAGTDI